MRPTRNNRGIAHENGGIESPHGHLKKAVRDALLMRGTGDFDDLTSYRCFIDEIVSRKNAHHARRIEAERPALQLLPGQRTCDHEDAQAVADAWAAIISSFRSRMLALPAKIAPLAHGARTLAEAASAVRDAVDEALIELARQPVIGIDAAPGRPTRLV
jgi:hypothetical protein